VHCVAFCAGLIKKEIQWECSHRTRCGAASCSTFRRFCRIPQDAENASANAHRPTLTLDLTVTSGVTRGWMARSSHSFTCHPNVYPWMEWAILLAFRKHSPDDVARARWRTSGSTYYSSIDPERMKGWVGLVGWPYSGWFTHISGHSSAIDRAFDRESLPVNVLPLCKAANCARPAIPKGKPRFLSNKSERSQLALWHAIPAANVGRKSPIWTYSTFIWHPIGMTSLEFRRDLWHQKTSIPWLSYDVVCVILHLAILYSAGLWQTGGHTDGRTDTWLQHIPR